MNLIDDKRQPNNRVSNLLLNAKEPYVLVYNGNIID